MNIHFNFVNKCNPKSSDFPSRSPRSPKGEVPAPWILEGGSPFRGSGGSDGIFSTMLAFLLVFCAISCVNDPQDIPPGLQTNPVFYADVILGQESLHLSAGDDGYTMKTEHFVDGEGITHYVATFASESCPQLPCPEFEIEFFDHQVISHPESGVEYTFLTGTKEYYNAEQDGTLDITFFLVQDGFGPSVSFWTTSGDSMPLTSSEIHLTAQPDEYVDLCFHRFGNSDCNGFASYCFHTLASSPFLGLLKADRSYGDHILVEMVLQGNPPFSYTWMNGATTPFILIPAKEGEEFGVGVVVMDAAGSRIEITQTIRIQNGLTKMCGGTPQFVYSIADAPFTQFSTVIVRYTDRNGMAYSSAHGLQTDGLFEILSISDFDESPEGFATKQIELAIAATLYSPDGTQEIDLTSGNTVVAVSYER